MQTIIYLLTLVFLSSGCQSSGSTNRVVEDTLLKQVVTKDTLKPPPVPKPYSKIDYEKKELLSAAGGTKSVIFNASGTKLYAMNLEGMSVYEFDQASRKITREFKFTPTRGMGWDYNKSRPIASFQEKPVEACFSHGDEILWVSLH
ncbi:MAG: hypothetical protein ABL876_12225, partial [Chitinophagaceae bacterium]